MFTSEDTRRARRDVSSRSELQGLLAEMHCLFKEGQSETKFPGGVANGGDFMLRAL